MAGFFEALFNMSITGCVVIAVVLVARLLLKGAPKKYSYMLWAVAGFRLCCPVSFRSIISIFNVSNALRQGNVATGSGTMNYTGAVVSVTPDETAVPSNVIGGIEDTQGVIISSRPMEIFNSVVPYVWICGIVVLLLYALISYINLRKTLATATKYDGNIFQSDRITSPFILGIIKPKIYIPYGVDEEYYSYVIEHEKYHLKRGDNYVKLLAFVVLALHWFNPLCWVAFILMSRDMEMSCDEWVLAHNDGIKKQYSQALLSFATNKSFPSPSPLCFGEGSAKSRIKNVLKFKKPTVIVSVIVVLLCVAVGVVCIANPNTVVDGFSGNTDISDIENMNIGAQMPDIIYADDEQVVFYGTCGIIIFDYENQRITDRINWSQIDGLKWSRDREFINVFASKKGERIYINEITQTSEQNYEYVYDVKKKKLNESKTIHSVNDDVYVAENLLDDNSRWYGELLNSNFLKSATGAVVGDKLLYLRANTDWSMKSLELVVSEADNLANADCIPVFNEKNAVSKNGYITGFEKLGEKNYQPFILNGNYEDYNTQVPSGTVKNQLGGVFGVVKAETKLLDESLESSYTRAIEYKTESGKNTVLMTYHPDVYLLAYIDDNLFFSAGDTIYRMKLLYNGDEIKNKEVFFVHYGQYGLRYSDDSNLLLTADKEKLFLDTRTGEMSTWDMTKYLPKISEAQAIKAARSAVGNKLEKDIVDFEQQSCKLRNSNCISGKDNGSGNPLYEVAFFDQSTTSDTYYIYIDAENGNYVSCTMMGD